MEREKLLGAIEAIIFAAGEPVAVRDLKKILERWVKDNWEEEPMLTQETAPDAQEGDAEGHAEEQGEADELSDSRAASDASSGEAAAGQDEQGPTEDVALAGDAEGAAPESALARDTPATSSTLPERASAVAATPAWLAELPDLLEELEEKWPQDPRRGFCLVKVAQGYTFRSNPAYADVLQSVREQRPVRLSKAAMETLAIIAYRQPATKPDIDFIRGVDCGGTIRMLLDRGLIRIIGKKDEPGRPLLYGTSKEFLSFFNLGSLNHLPTLRDVQELGEESIEELKSFDLDLEDLKKVAKTMQLESEPSIDALDEAMAKLKDTEKTTRTALAEEGIELMPDPDDEPRAVEESAPGAEGPGEGTDHGPAKSEPRGASHSAPRGSAEASP